MEERIQNKKSHIPNTVAVKILGTVNLKENDWYKDPRFIFPFTISLISFVLSLVALGVFSNFNLDILIDGVYISPVTITESKEKEQIHFLLPISFINTGKTGEIVDDLTLKTEFDGEILQHNPAFELDINEFQNKRCLIGSVTKKPYSPFNLKANDEIDKFIWFPANVGNISFGKYTLIITAHAGNYEYETEIIIEITEFMLERYLMGDSFYIPSDVRKIKFGLAPSNECSSQVVGYERF